MAIVLVVFRTSAFGQMADTVPSKVFADKWEYVGVAVQEPGYTIWGTSPIVGKDGRIHLFVARWPCSLKVDPGWRSHSEIAHYVGNKPEGPFLFSDVALQRDTAATWDKFGLHNPTIHKVDNLYVLLYIANDNPTQPPHPANQKIGMATALSLGGPWRKVGKDGMILSTPDDANSWNYQSSNGVNNPAFLKHPSGRYFLYFKSHQAKMGLAMAESLIGPYVQMPFPVTENDKIIEDGYAFMSDGKVQLLTTDNHGMIEPGAGILWTSTDGIRFENFEKGMHRISDYTQVDLSKVAMHYGPESQTYTKAERPQLLIIDGEPRYLYVSSGHNIYGGDCTISYVLKNIN
ncbi:MAG: hypothetical protein HKN87_08425 [Saprospiraceae bacterium]|nr:hypothetical protein [Saprospiraceae bacterium]